MPREKGTVPLRQAVQRLDERLAHQLARLWDMAEAGIQEAQKSKDGHQQGPSHCRAVEANLSYLIPDDRKGDKLTALDLFALSAAAALHDAGKAGDWPGDHGQVAMHEVRGRALAFGLDEAQAKIVGWLIGAHNNGRLDDLPTGPVPAGAAEVRVRPLAALFKLADALHTDRSRVPLQVVEMGGRHPTDGKTRFRLCLDGWVFDDQGRVALCGAPKDWSEAELLQEGLQRTRQELEPVVATLRDAGYPWELVLQIDSTDLVARARQEAEPRLRAERAFVDMDHFREADAAHFMGRDDDADALFGLVLNCDRPVTLLVGDSGVGKSSLIHAGLLPRLHKIGGRTACVRPFDDPDRYLVRDLWQALLPGEPPQGQTIVQALEAARLGLPGEKLFVVIDQLEDALRAPLQAMRQGLEEAIRAVQGGRFWGLHLLLSYRADAEGALGPLLQRASGAASGFPRFYLEPLTRSGARAALQAGFKEAMVGVDAPLLDTLAADLDNQTTPGVYPPFVQMVGATLCRLARGQNEGILTEELYHGAGGCPGIIGHYLLHRLEGLGEQREAARQVLVALARYTGSKDHRTRAELVRQCELDEATLGALLETLVHERLVRPLGNGEYELVHDYLAELVSRNLIDDEERHGKRLSEILQLKAAAYPTSHLLLHRAELVELYALRRGIKPDAAQLELLLHSGLANEGPCWYWLRDAGIRSVLPYLRRALSHPYPVLRQATVRALGQLGVREAVPDLRAFLQEDDLDVRRETVQAIVHVFGSLGHEGIPDLRRLLHDSNDDIRRAAVVALGRLGAQEAIPDLCTILEDDNKDVAWRAAHALGQLGAQEASPELRVSLKDDNRDVRRMAAYALSQIGAQAALSDLRILLRDSDWLVRCSAAQALGHLGAHKVIPELRALLEDDNSDVRRAAAHALGRLGAREAIPDMRALLYGNHGWLTKKAVAQALGEIGAIEAIPDLRALLDTREYELPQMVAMVLVRNFSPLQLGGNRDLRALIQDRDRAVQKAAIRVLGERGVREAIPDLCALLRGNDKDVWGVAALSLGELGAHEAIPDLRALLHDSYWTAREEAAHALGQLSAREAIPDLRVLLDESDIGCRQAAAKALQSLMMEEDMDWLAAWILDHSFSPGADDASRLLAALDRRFYSPLLPDEESTDLSLFI
jgi:HEAT repeat protein